MYTHWSPRAQIISTLVNVSFQIRGVTEQEKTWLHPWKTIEEMVHTRSSVRGRSLLQQPPFKNFEPTGNPYTPALMDYMEACRERSAHRIQLVQFAYAPASLCMPRYKNLVMGNQLKRYQSALCVSSYDFWRALPCARVTTEIIYQASC